MIEIDRLYPKPQRFMILFATCLLVTTQLSAEVKPALRSQTDPSVDTAHRTNMLRIYLDCDGCDETLIRQEIDFVEYVRDRKQANLHLLGTVESTGGKGREYDLRFIGQEEFEDLNYSLIYRSLPTDTESERLDGLNETLLLGLAPFLSQTPLKDRISLSVDAQEEKRPAQVDDRWNSWVFQIKGSSDYDIEESQEEYEYDVELEAERITLVLPCIRRRW